MSRSQNRNNTGATQPFERHFTRIGCAALVFLLFSCSSLNPTQQEIPAGEASAFLPRYSIIFIIHGDGAYLFYDPDGHAHRADEEALGGAIRVAERNPQAEVFIFHERPRRHAFLFFPLRDGKFYYYRGGQLLARESYRRNQGSSRFDPEARLYDRFRTAGQPRPKRFFLYFGHEIPEFDGRGYDASYSHRTFTVRDLADGLELTTRDTTKFDLIVLSTCFNGTPHTIDTLAPYARTIIASPDNLHRSYFDLQPFERLDVGLQNGDTAVFARAFARQAFDRLSEDIQTTITVAVYDVERVQGFLHTVEGAYDHTLTTLKEQSPGFFEHYDCAEDTAYALPNMSEGVDVFYQPPRFGRLRHKENHSGWECWKLPKKSLSKQQL